MSFRVLLLLSVLFFFSISALPSAYAEGLICNIANPSSTIVATQSVTIGCGYQYPTCSAVCNPATTQACCNVEGQYIWGVAAYGDLLCTHWVTPTYAGTGGNAYSVNWDTQTYCTSTCAGLGGTRPVAWIAGVSQCCGDDVPGDEPDNNAAFCSGCTIGLNPGARQWSIGGDAAPTACCGDDSNEYVRPCQDSSEGFCSGSIQRCCQSSTSCAYSGGSGCLSSGLSVGEWRCNSGTWHDNVAPAVSVTGAPASWQRTPATATVTCTDGGSGCVSSSYRMNTFPSNPGSCSAPSTSCNVYNTEASCLAHAGCTPNYASCSTVPQSTCEGSPPSGCSPVYDGACILADYPYCLSLSGCEDNSDYCQGSYYTHCSGNYFTSCTGTTSPFPLTSPSQISDYAWVCGSASDRGSNTGFSAPVEFKIDNSPPVTTDNALTTWYINSASITLTCTDVGSGCDQKNYCVGANGVVCTPNILYLGPISVTTGGVNKLCYFSRDIAGNIETAHCTDVKVDTANPELNSYNIQSKCDSYDTSVPTDRLCWKKGGTTFSPETETNDSQSTPAFQELAFAESGCDPAGSCSPLKLIKSSVNVDSGSFSDLVTDDTYLNINSATCITSGGCTGQYANMRWSAAVGSPEKDYKIYTNLSDQSGRKTGYVYSNWILGVDSTTPTTSIACNGATCVASYRTLSVTFSCSDARSGCATGTTMWCESTTAGCTGFMPYDGGAKPITGDGTHYIRYYSSDNVGNAESIKTTQVIIDSTSPQLWIQPLPQWKKADSDGYVRLSVTRNATDNYDPSGATVAMSMQYAVLDGGVPILINGNYWTPWAWASPTGNLTKDFWLMKDNVIYDSTAPGGMITISDAAGLEGRSIAFRMTGTDVATNAATYPAGNAYTSGPWPNTTIDRTPPTCAMGAATVVASGKSVQNGGYSFVNGPYNMSPSGTEDVSGIASYDVNIKSPELAGTWHPIGDAGFCSSAGLEGTDYRGSMVGWWSLEGNAQDRSITVNNGQIVGAPAAAAGKFGQSMLFHGSNDYISIASSDSLKLANDMTYSFWIYPVANPTSMGVVYSNPGTSWIFLDNIMRISFEQGGPPWDRIISSPVGLNQWTHVVITKSSAGAVKIYINGAIDQTGSITLPSLSTPSYIGTWYASTLSSYVFNGMIDELMIYNITLSPAEVSALYRSQTQSPAPIPSVSCTPGANNNVYEFSCRATDKAGNVGTWSAPNTSVKVDTVDPHATFDDISQWIGRSSREWLGSDYFNVSWDSDRADHFEDSQGSGVDCFYVQWKNTTVDWTPVTCDTAAGAWGTTCKTDLTCLPPVKRYVRFGSDFANVYKNITRLVEDLRYSFRIMAVDNLGNAGSWSTLDSILDWTSPKISVNITDDKGNSYLPWSVLDWKLLNKVNITSNVTDSISGVQISIIEKTVDSTATDVAVKSTSIKSNCVNSNKAIDWAAPDHGGWVVCNTTTDFAEGTSLTFNATVTDRAGNINYTQGVLTTHPLANFMIHFAVLQLGMSVDIPVQIRNMKSSTQSVTAYLEGLDSTAAFLPASGATLEQNNRVLRVDVSANEQRTFYVRVMGNDVTDQPQRLNLSAYTLLSQDNDTAYIMVTYPAEFPAFDAAWAVLLMMAFAALVFYRTEKL